MTSSAFTPCSLPLHAITTSSAKEADGEVVIAGEDVNDLINDKHPLAYA